MLHHEGNRRGSTGFIQKISLFFLVGFFVGALFYYFFQNSFLGLSEQMEKNSNQWFLESYGNWYPFFYVLWSHGKYFLILWILSVNKKVCQWYQNIFTVYTGIRHGFLVLFFVLSRGAKGILFYLASLFPQVLLLVPVYVFSFLWINESRQPKHGKAVVGILFLLFVAACLLEVKVNLVIMNKIL